MCTFGSWLLVVYVHRRGRYVVDYGRGRLNLRRRFASLGSLVYLHGHFAGHAPAAVAHQREEILLIVDGIIRSGSLWVVRAILLSVRTHTTRPGDGTRHPVIQDGETLLFELHDVEELTVDQIHRRICHGLQDNHGGTPRRDDAFTHTAIRWRRVRRPSFLPRLFGATDVHSLG
jgi:hypothetical protein